jgi:hypothetical protein
MYPKPLDSSVDRVVAEYVLARIVDPDPIRRSAAFLKYVALDKANYYW